MTMASGQRVVGVVSKLDILVKIHVMLGSGKDGECNVGRTMRRGQLEKGRAVEIRRI